MRPATLLLFLSLTSCASSPAPQVEAAQPRAQARPQPQPAAVFRFGWRPGRIAVVERVESKGVAETLDYVLMVDAHGEELWVNYEDIHRERGGHDTREALRPTEKLDQLRRMPMDMRIDEGGIYLGLVDPAAVTVKAREITDSDGSLLAALANPKVLATLEQAAGKAWEAWVQAWIDWQLAPGEVFEGDVEADLGTAGTITEHLRCEHLGDAPGRSGLVWLRCQAAIDDPRYAAALVAMFGEIAPRPEGSASAERAASTMQVRRRTTVEVVIEPNGLHPAWAHTMEEITGFADGKQHEIREVHEWTFTPLTQ